MKIKYLFSSLTYLSFFTLPIVAQNEPQRFEPKKVVELDFRNMDQTEEGTKRMRPRMIESDVKPWRIGLMVNPIDDALRNHLDIPENTGVVVSECVENAPAAKAGIQKNDIILSAKGRPVSSIDTLREAVMESAKSGDPLRLDTLRKGQRREVVIKPDLPKPPISKPNNRPDQAPTPFDSPKLREQERRMQSMMEQNELLMKRIAAMESLMKNLQKTNEKPSASDAAAQREQEKMMRSMAEQNTQLKGRFESMDTMMKRLEKIEAEMKKAQREMNRDAPKANE